MFLRSIQIREGTQDLWFLTHLVIHVASAVHNEGTCAGAVSLPPHNSQYLLLVFILSTPF